MPRGRGAGRGRCSAAGARRGGRVRHRAALPHDRRRRTRSLGPGGRPDGRRTAGWATSPPSGLVGAPSGCLLRGNTPGVTRSLFRERGPIFGTGVLVCHRFLVFCAVHFDSYGSTVFHATPEWVTPAQRVGSVMKVASNQGKT